MGGQLGKPVMLGEFGYEGAPWDIYKPWMDAFETQKGAGALIWEIICATVCGNYGGSLAAVYPSSSPVPPGMAQFAATANADKDAPPVGPKAPAGPTGLALVSAPPNPAPFTIAPSSASPSSALTGQAVALSTTVTGSTAMTGVTVDIGGYSASNVTVGSTAFTGQTFAAGVARSFNWTWPGSFTAGTYTVKVGVFNADRSTLYKSENAAASITVGGPSFTATSTTVSPSALA